MKKITLIMSILFLTISIGHANTGKKDDKICSGFGKWTKDGEFKIIRSNCTVSYTHLTLPTRDDV